MHVAAPKGPVHAKAPQRGHLGCSVTEVCAFCSILPPHCLLGAFCMHFMFFLVQIQLGEDSTITIFINIVSFGASLAAAPAVQLLHRLTCLQANSTPSVLPVHTFASGVFACCRFFCKARQFSSFQASGQAQCSCRQGADKESTLRNLSADPPCNALQAKRCTGRHCDSATKDLPCNALQARRWARTAQ